MPTPPNPLLYSYSEFAKHQLRYLDDLQEWQRESDWIMWASAIPVVCAAVGVIVLAVMGPGIALDMIRIMAVQ